VLEDLMYRFTVWDLTLERIRREITTSDHGENSRDWQAAYDRAWTKRDQVAKRIKALLTSGTFEYDRKDGFKRSR